MHSLDLLALMTIGFEKDEGIICWKDNGICRKAVCATTVLDQCVFPVFSIWQSASMVIILVCIFVIAANKTFIEVWKTRIFSSPSLENSFEALVLLVGYVSFREAILFFVILMLVQNRNGNNLLIMKIRLSSL